MESVSPTNIPYLFLRRRIIDVGKIPGQQKIHPMHRSQSNMNRVIRSVRRGGLLPNQCLRELYHLGRDLQPAKRTYKS